MRLWDHRKNGFVAVTLVLVATFFVILWWSREVPIASPANEPPAPAFVPVNALPDESPSVLPAAAPLETGTTESTPDTPRASDPVTPVGAPALDPQPMSDRCDCATAWHTRKLERERMARRAEPKDINWAYETEQLLRQFIVNDERAQMVEVTDIVCRTSHCELTLVGPQESQATLEVIIIEATTESWSSLSSSWSINQHPMAEGLWEFQALMQRRAPETAGNRHGHWPQPALEPDDVLCECATPEWRQQRTLREEQRLAAERKDPDWAYATEQALQLFIVGLPDAVHFEITTIDCRTTFCDLHAMGHTSGSVEVFQSSLREAVVQTTSGLKNTMSFAWQQQGEQLTIQARVTRVR